MPPSVERLTDSGKARASRRLSSWWSMALLSPIWEAGDGDEAVVGGVWQEGCPWPSPKTWLKQNPWTVWMSHILRFAPFVAKFSKRFGCSKYLIFFRRYVPAVKLYVVVCQIKNNCSVHPLMQLIFKREFLVVVNLGHA